MTDRHVTGVRRDGQGGVIALCGPWGSVDSASAIQQIQNGMNTYFVMMGGVRVSVTAAPGYNGAYLRTARSATMQNGLDVLPGC